MNQRFEIAKGNTIIVFRVLDMDCPDDHWIITAEYVREYPAISENGELSEKERADRLEEMVDRMSKTIVEKQLENFQLKERLVNLEKMITGKA